MAQLTLSVTTPPTQPANAPFGDSSWTPPSPPPPKKAGIQPVARPGFPDSIAVSAVPHSRLDSIPNHHKETAEFLRRTRRRDSIPSQRGSETKSKLFSFIKRRGERSASIPALTSQCDPKETGKTQGLRTRVHRVASFIRMGKKKPKTNG